MANISIRKLDKHAYEQLRMRAKKHGVSMEEEVRHIIYQAISTPDKISVIFKKHFGPKKGIDLKLAKQRPHDPLDFEE